MRGCLLFIGCGPGSGGAYLGSMALLRLIAAAMNRACSDWIIECSMLLV